MAMRMSRARRREAWDGYIMASPWIVGFFLFTAFPCVASILLSFAEYNIISPPVWVGLANYGKFLTDDYIVDTLRVTFTYTVIAVPLGTVGSLALAVLLNQGIPFLKLYRTLFYLPACSGGAATAILWTVLLNPNFGVFNTLLRYVGIKGPNWLGDPKTALFSLIFMGIWGWGAGTILYLANMQAIPTNLYEAAKIDGATGFKSFFRITLPLITPVLFYRLTMGMIGSLQTFHTAYLMTGGGPQRSTLFFMLHLYRTAWRYLAMGYAAAMAWLLFVIIMIITVIQIKVADRWVYYEGGGAR